MVFARIRRILRRRQVLSQRSDIEYLTKKLQMLIHDVRSLRRDRRLWRDTGDPKAQARALEARSRVRREIRKLERSGHTRLLKIFMVKYHIEPRWFKRLLHTRLG